MKSPFKTWLVRLCATVRPWRLGLPCRFIADRCGATAVEFGLIAVPFLAMLCATFELGFANYMDETLANSINDAARAMLTGKLQMAGVTTTQQFVAQYLCPATGRTLPMNFNCANFIIDVRPASSFAAGDTTNDFYASSSNEFCPGQAGQIMVLRVAYPLPAILPLNLFSPSSGVVNNVPNLPGNYHILLASALFLEENYVGAYTPPANC